MSRKALCAVMATLLGWLLLVSCGRGALTSVSNTSPDQSTSTAEARAKAEQMQTWFIQLNSAVENFAVVAAEIVQQVDGAMEQSLPGLRAIVLSVPPTANAKDLLKDVRIRLIVTEKEYLMNATAAKPSPKSTTPQKSDKKKK